jgi:hypothetical protein
VKVGGTALFQTGDKQQFLELFWAHLGELHGSALGLLGI